MSPKNNSFHKLSVLAKLWSSIISRLKLQKNELHCCINHKILTNLTVMQQFLTLLKPYFWKVTLVLPYWIVNDIVSFRLFGLVLIGFLCQLGVDVLWNVWPGLLLDMCWRKPWSWSSQPAGERELDHEQLLCQHERQHQQQPWKCEQPQQHYKESNKNQSTIADSDHFIDIWYYHSHLINQQTTIL